MLETCTFNCDEILLTNSSETSYVPAGEVVEASLCCVDTELVVINPSLCVVVALVVSSLVVACSDVALVVASCVAFPPVVIRCSGVVVETAGVVV